MRKGKIEEIFSKDGFSDNPEEYKIFYRDFDSIRETTLPQFILDSDNFENIPISRVEKIMKNDKVVFEKNRGVRNGNS